MLPNLSKLGSSIFIRLEHLESSMIVVVVVIMLFSIIVVVVVVDDTIIINYYYYYYYYSSKLWYPSLLGLTWPPDSWILGLA